MARAILLAAALVWGLAALATLLAAIIGVETMVRLLPPLSIDTDALRGAIVAVTVGLGLGTASHVAVVVGLRSGNRRAASIAILLSALLCVTFVTLAAAAVTSAVATPASAAPLLGGGLAAALAAIAYGFTVAALVGELRARSAS